MKLITTEDQFSAIHLKFCDLRAEVAQHRYPAGARPGVTDLWAMATQLVIAENT